MKTLSASVAEVKAHFSKYVAKSAYSDFRIIITKRSRPVAALVSLIDLQELEQQHKRRGLSAVIGRWENFEEIAGGIEEAIESRQLEGDGRHVSL